MLDNLRFFFECFGTCLETQVKPFWNMFSTQHFGHLENTLEQAILWCWWFDWSFLKKCWKTIQNQLTTLFFQVIQGSAIQGIPTPRVNLRESSREAGEALERRATQEMLSDSAIWLQHLSPRSDVKSNLPIWGPSFTTPDVRIRFQPWNFRYHPNSRRSHTWGETNRPFSHRSRTWRETNPHPRRAIHPMQKKTFKRIRPWSSSICARVFVCHPWSSPHKP